VTSVIRGDGCVTGRTYLEFGQSVVVLIRRWRRGAGWSGDFPILGKAMKFGPRNVLIEREDGSRVVRSFRGLRRSAATEASP
jgi:acetyl esterase